MELTVAEYRRQEESAMRAIPAHLAGLFQYPSAWIPESGKDLRRLIDTQYVEYQDLFARCAGKLSGAEFDSLQWLLGLQCEYSENVFGEQQLGVTEALQAVLVQRALRETHDSAPSIVVVIGDNCGLTAAALCNQRSSTITFEWRLPQYLLQSSFGRAIPEISFHELATEPINTPVALASEPISCLHAPWWWVEALPTLIRNHAISVILHSSFGELTPAAQQLLLHSLRQVFTDAPQLLSTICSVHATEHSVEQRRAVFARLLNAGFQLSHADAATAIWIATGTDAAVNTANSESIVLEPSFPFFAQDNALAQRTRARRERAVEDRIIPCEQLTTILELLAFARDPRNSVV